MSGEQGQRKGKKRRNRGRGRGQQQQQQQQQQVGRAGPQERSEETRETSGLSVDERSRETLTEQTRSPEQTTTTTTTTREPLALTTVKQDDSKQQQQQAGASAVQLQEPASTAEPPQTAQHHQPKTTIVQQAATPTIPPSPEVVSPQSSTRTNAPLLEIGSPPQSSAHDSAPRSKSSKRNRGRKKKAETAAGAAPEVPELSSSTTTQQQPPDAVGTTSDLPPASSGGGPKSTGKHGSKEMMVQDQKDHDQRHTVSEKKTSASVQPPPSPSMPVQTTIPPSGMQSPGTAQPASTVPPPLGTTSRPQQSTISPPASKSLSSTTRVPGTQSPATTSTTVQPASTEAPPPLATTSKSAPKQAPRQPSSSTTPENPPQSGPGARPKTQRNQQQPPMVVSSHPPHDANLRPPKRPDKGGESGRKIKLRVNFFAVTLPKNDIHHYDTAIKAKGLKTSGDGYTKSEARRIIDKMAELYIKENPQGPRLVYDRDGKNIYCRTPIPGIGKDRREFNVSFTTDNGKQREYTVTVKWASQVSLYELEQAIKGHHTEVPQDTMQAIQVVLRHLPSQTSIPVGASFFKNPNPERKDLGFGMQAWNGTFLSFRPTQWTVVLNIDTCTSVFYKAQPVVQFIREYFKRPEIPRSLNNDECKKFGKEMKGVKIQVAYKDFKRKQKVNGYSKSARTHRFKCEGKEMTVFDYFKQTHGITLQYPDLPCVKLGATSYIPVEFCTIMEGQRKESTLQADQTRELIRHTALPAPQREQKIKGLVRDANFAGDPYLRDFGIGINPEMTTVPGRVLAPPRIVYGAGRDGRPAKEDPKDGKWNMQHLSVKPVEVKVWAIISFENPRFLNEQAVDFFIKNLVQGGREKGLQINPSPCQNTTGRGHNQIQQKFKELHQRYPNLQLLIVILPGRVDQRENVDLSNYYEAVKHFGDVVYGINTQCISCNTAKNKATDKQTMANICLKLNAKLGGTTFVLDQEIRSAVFKRPVIIFGADVTRASSEPAIAAVVASMDKHPNQYSAEVRVQKPRQEKIEDLKEMVKSLLKKFYQNLRAKPEKIIFYRDGVGEGQFMEILTYELRAIQRACVELDPAYKPAITFIIVQKRHHAKIFAVDPRDQCGKSKNIPPGTIVDQGICHPQDFDWYLCSHAGIQGTSKSAHYYVLYDDSKFTSDELQILSHQLCHTYVRCARAVSIPAPAYYAHHVAFRARYHLRNATSEGSTCSSDMSDQGPTEEMIRAVTVHHNMNTAMYFA